MPIQKNKQNLRRDTLEKIQRSNPSQLIALRLEYSIKAKRLSTINTLAGLDRVYSTHLPTQKSFRWSTSDPAITNFERACINPYCPDYEHEDTEECWGLRDIVLPNEDEVLVVWDHDNIEGRVHDLYLNDQENLIAHKERYDLHTITCCKMFKMDLPMDLRDPHSSDIDKGWREKYAWQGKDTQRRVMAKNLNHGSKYAISIKYVHTIPNIEKYGLSPKELEAMAQEHMDLKKDVMHRKRQVMMKIKKERVARNLYGARRLFYDGSEETAKEGFSFIISSTVSLFNNETLINMKKIWPRCRLIHNAHDGDKVCFPKDEVPSIDELKTVIVRPMQWEGREVMLTAGVKVYE